MGIFPKTFYLFKVPLSRVLRPQGSFFRPKSFFDCSKSLFPECYARRGLFSSKIDFLFFKAPLSPVLRPQGPFFSSKIGVLFFKVPLSRVLRPQGFFFKKKLLYIVQSPSFPSSTPAGAIFSQKNMCLCAICVYMYLLKQNTYNFLNIVLFNFA